MLDTRDETQRTGVINCAAYSGGQRIADLPICDISEALKQSDRSSGSGCTSPRRDSARGAAGVRPARPRDRRRPTAHQRPKLELYEGSLFVVLRTAQLAADERPRVRRDPRVRRSTLHRVGPPRIAQVARRPARPVRSDAPAPSQGPGLRPLRADGLHRRSVLPDRRGARGASSKTRRGDLRGDVQPRARRSESTSLQARSARAEAGGRRRSSTSATA